MLRDGQLEEAVKQYAIAVDQEGLLRQPDHQQAKAYDSLAMGLSRIGDVDGAIQAAEKAVALTPGGSDHLLRLASVYAEHERWDDSINALRRAIENRPERALLHQKLGVVLTRTWSWNEARQAFEKASQLATMTLPDLQTQTAQVDWMLGRRQTAEAALDQIGDPDTRREAWSTIAGWLATGDDAKGYRLARRKAGLPEEDTDTLRSQYRTSIAVRQFDEASKLLKELRTAATTNDEQVYVAVEEAKLDFLSGRQTGAIKRLEQLKTRPSDFAARLDRLGRRLSLARTRQESYRGISASASTWPQRQLHTQ